MNSEKRPLLRAAGLVSAITLLSRFFGLARDWVLATALGASQASDVFRLAFEVPNLARRILGEGGLSAFIVPILTKVRSEEGKDAAWKFASNALTVMSLFSMVLLGLGIFLAKPIFMIFYKSENASAIALGTNLTQIMLPFLLILTICSLLMGMCHTIRHFATPTFGSIMLNISMITTGLIFMEGTDKEVTNSLVITDFDVGFTKYLALSVLAGGLLRLVIMIPPLMKAGFRFTLVFKPKSERMKNLYIMILPALFGLAVVQLNITISRAFATRLEDGAVTALTMSNRLVQLPLAIVAMSLSTAILPQISQLWIEKKIEDLKNLTRFAFSLIIILFAPATVGLCVLGFPIINLIFNNGRWDEKASALTYEPLIYYASGLILWGMLKILTPIFYAARDVRTPVITAAIAMIINIALNIILISVDPIRETLGTGGLALANTISLVIDVGLLMWILKKREFSIWNKKLSLTALKATIAAAVMGGSAWLLWDIFGVSAVSTHRMLGLAALLVVILVSVGVYLLTAYLLRIPDLSEAMNILIKRLRKTS